MDITPLPKEDVERAADLLRTYWAERGMDYSKRWTESYLTKGHGKEITHDVTLVLKEDATVLGVIAVILYEGQLAELRDFVVQKEFRGRGYGKLLMNGALEFCIKNQARKVIALIFPQHEPLFSAFGFLREGYLRSHFKDNEDLVLVSRLIPQGETQANLKTQLNDLSMIKDIESETSERLRMMKSKK